LFHTRIGVCSVSNAHSRRKAIWCSNLLFLCGCVAAGDALALRLGEKLWIRVAEGMTKRGGCLSEQAARLGVSKRFKRVLAQLGGLALILACLLLWCACRRCSECSARLKSCQQQRLRRLRRVVMVCVKCLGFRPRAGASNAYWRRWVVWR
jgi:hypothetical protein